MGGRTVITVTRLRASRNGKGRSVDAAPVGYIEVTSAGSEYHAIEEPSPGPSRGLRAAATAATTLVGVLAGARALRAARRPSRLLPPGRR